MNNDKELEMLLNNTPCNLCNKNEATQLNPIQGPICDECYKCLLEFVESLKTFVANGFITLIDTPLGSIEQHEGRTLKECFEFADLEDQFGRGTE